jgi:hypothetical protein
MAFEKRYAAIAARLFVSDGQANGNIELPTTSSFKVKQKVVVTASGEPNQELEVKAVFSDTILKVGPISGNIRQGFNLSAYTVAKNAAILADEQPRAGITGDEIRRAVYDEEPTMAYRNVMVDEFGRYWDKENRFPVDIGAEINVENLNLNVDLEGFDLTKPDSVLVTGSEDGTKTGVKHSLKIGNDLNLRVKDEEAINVLTEIDYSIDAGNLHLSDISLSNEGILSEAQDANATLEEIRDSLQEPLQISQPIITAGTSNGEANGTVYVNVVNVKSQILAAADRDQQIFYADFGTKNQRVTHIDYISPTFFGVVARKEFTYVLESGRYKRTNITWTIE